MNWCYILYGEETYLLETYLKKIKKEFGEMHTGINYIELDDENFVNLLMQEIQTPAFGYNKKMIIVKNSGLLKKEAKKKTAGLKELRDTLEEYLKEYEKELKENLVLIFIEDGVEKLNITKTIEAMGGTVCEFKEENPIQLEKRLTAICNAYKVNAENGAIKYLIEVSGTNMQVLVNEIRKLIEYAGEGRNYKKRRCISTCNKNTR